MALWGVCSGRETCFLARIHFTGHFSIPTILMGASLVDPRAKGEKFPRMGSVWIERYGDDQLIDKRRGIGVVVGVVGGRNDQCSTCTQCRKKC